MTGGGEPGHARFAGGAAGRSRHVSSICPYRAIWPRRYTARDRGRVDAADAAECYSAVGSPIWPTRFPPPERVFGLLATDRDLGDLGHARFATRVWPCTTRVWSRTTRVWPCTMRVWSRTIRCAVRLATQVSRAERGKSRTWPEPELGHARFAGGGGRDGSGHAGSPPVAEIAPTPPRPPSVIGPAARVPGQLAFPGLIVFSDRWPLAAGRELVVVNLAT